MGMNLSVESLSTRPTVLNKILILFSIASTIFVSCTVFFSSTEEEYRIYVLDIIEPLAAAVALGISLVVVYRQKLDGLFGKTYASLAAGLVLWFIAEVLWSFFEFGSDHETPSLLRADFFWLAGYGAFIYYGFSMYTFFGKRPSKRNVAVISIPCVLFLAYSIQLNVSDYELTKQEGIILFCLSNTYVALDLVLIILAALLISSPGKKGQLTSIPWIFIAFLIIAIGDSGLGYTESTEILYTHILYICGYIVMTAGIFWHNQIFVFDEKRVLKKWQVEHR
jgi:hypothetical protein